MKEFVIYQENSPPIKFFDEEISEEDIKKIFESKKIIKIESNNRTIHIRPSKLISIDSYEVNNKTKLKKSKKDEEENIITDEE